MTTATSAHTSTLRKQEEIAQGTMAFLFAKSADFQFRAGQWVDIALLNPPEIDAEGNTRAFSIASAPGLVDRNPGTEHEVSPRRNHMRDGEITPRVERRDWVHRQGHACEAPVYAPGPDRLHRRTASYGGRNASHADRSRSR
jgi:hypothetical protein